MNVLASKSEIRFTNIIVHKYIRNIFFTLQMEKTSDKALEWTTPGTNYKKENGKRGMQSLGCGK